MAVKEVHGPGPRGARGPRPKVENPGKLLRRIMDEVFRNYLPHCILVLICIVVSALANVQASLFLQTLMDDYIVPMTRQQDPSFAPLAGALVREVRPTALICVDSLCSSEPQRLGRTLQFSDTGLCPAQPGSSKHLDAARLGLPVIAAGIPTLMMAQEGKDLVVTPRELDSVIAHGAALLGAAINRALQPRLSIAQLCWLVG